MTYMKALCSTTAGQKGSLQVVTNSLNISLHFSAYQQKHQSEVRVELFTHLLYFLSTLTTTWCYFSLVCEKGRGEFIY